MCLFFVLSLALTSCSGNIYRVSNHQQYPSFRNQQDENFFYQNQHIHTHHQHPPPMYSNYINNERYHQRHASETTQLTYKNEKRNIPHTPKIIVTDPDGNEFAPEHESVNCLSKTQQVSKNKIVPKRRYHIKAPADHPHSMKYPHTTYSNCNQNMTPSSWEQERTAVFINMEEGEGQRKESIFIPISP